MKLPVIRAVQRGVTLYLGKITIEDLLSTCVITEWDPNLGWDLQNQGYQRAPIRKHFLAIGNFLASEEDPLLPTGALLSARESDYGQLKFTQASPNQFPDFGHLEIPDGRQIFIVDYQHRWRGFQFAINNLKKRQLNKFQVPFVLMANATKYEEIRQFYLINDKQKRIDTDLALALMQTLGTVGDEPELYNLVGPGKRYRIRATRLTFKIAELKTGCWVGIVQEPNNPKPSDVIAPKSFVDSLRPIISRRSSFRLLSDDTLIKIISSYWEGIKVLMPGAFGSPQEYAIQKTPGLFVMHRVAASSVFPFCTNTNDFSPNNVATILRPSVNNFLSEGFWKTGGPVSAYSSASGHKALADLIISSLPSLP